MQAEASPRQARFPGKIKPAILRIRSILYPLTHVFRSGKRTVPETKSGKKIAIYPYMKGFLYGIASSAAFGLIPLFTLPLMAGGMGFDTILFYRFLIASTAIAAWLLIRKSPFRLDRREMPVVALLSMLYAGSALFLFWGYRYLSSGIATTIHFLYPVFVTLIMIGLFREKKSVWTLLAVVLAVSGVALLSWGDGESRLSGKGILITAVSGLCYALYIVGVNKSRVRNLPGMQLTFYVLLFGSALFLAMARLKGTFQAVPGPEAWMNLLLLALVPTVVSNLTLVKAVRYIGSTLTAVLGAMEPLTAVCMGILVFHEPLTANLVAGIACIVTAVSLIILSGQLGRFVSRVRRRLVRISLER